MYFGVGLFYPCQGCPQPEAQEGGSADAPPAPDEGAALDAEACSAYSEVERVVAESSSGELRDMGGVQGCG